MMPCPHACKGEMNLGNNLKNSSIERNGGLGRIFISIGRISLEYSDKYRYRVLYGYLWEI